MNEPKAEQKEESGVDRTLIRARLALTPAERARVFVESARNVAKIIANVRRS
jgi:hypothetical protein